MSGDTQTGYAVDLDRPLQCCRVEPAAIPVADDLATDGGFVAVHQHGNDILVMYGFQEDVNVGICHKACEIHPGNFDAVFKGGWMLTHPIHLSH
jgi:hypothetical protein